MSTWHGRPVSLCLRQSSASSTSIAALRSQESENTSKAPSSTMYIGICAESAFAVMVICSGLFGLME